MNARRFRFTVMDARKVGLGLPGWLVEARLGCISNLVLFGDN